MMLSPDGRGESFECARRLARGVVERERVEVMGGAAEGIHLFGIVSKKHIIV